MKQLILFLIYIIISANNNTNTYTLDKIIAIVNEDIILESDIKKLKEINIKKQNSYQIKNNQSFSKKEMIDQLITDTLILQLAHQINMNIDDNQINEIINYIAKQNHMTQQHFLLYLSKIGINYPTYVDYIKKEAIINIICDYEMNRRIRILPNELNIMIKKITNSNITLQLNHILIPIKENTTNTEIEQAHSLAIFLAKEIRYGINIQQLQQLYSKNKKYPKIEIKNINWCTLEELPKLFSENLIKNKIKINNVIGPIQSGVGFHILKINNIDYNTNKNLLTKIHVRDIIIKKSKINNDQNIQKTLLKITKDIKQQNTTFSIEAKQLSEDYNSSSKGGDLGWQYLENFDKKLQIILQSLKKGDISPPIKINNEWHIMQIINTANIDKNETLIQNHAYQIIFNKKIPQAMNDWIQELKTISYIKILNNYDQ